MSEKTDKILGLEAHEIEKMRNDIKADLFRVLEAVDAGTFRAAMLVTFDEDKNTLRLWGDKRVLAQAAIRMLQKDGLLKT